MVDEPALIEHVMACGVDGFIGKSIAPDELGAAILAIRDGEVLVKYSPSGLLPNLGSANELEQLTQRQHEVLRLIAQGKTNKEIARALDISPFTVRIHVSSLLKALNVTTHRSGRQVQRHLIPSVGVDGNASDHAWAPGTLNP